MLPIPRPLRSLRSMMLMIMVRSFGTQTRTNGTFYFWDSHTIRLYLSLGETGYLDLQELNACLSEYMGSDISLELTQTVCSEFDKDATDTIDKAEFTMMVVRIYL